MLRCDEYIPSEKHCLVIIVILAIALTGAASRTRLSEVKSKQSESPVTIQK